MPQTAEQTLVFVNLFVTTETETLGLIKYQLIQFWLSRAKFGHTGKVGRKCSTLNYSVFGNNVTNSCLMVTKGIVVCVKINY